MEPNIFKLNGPLCRLFGCSYALVELISKISKETLCHLYCRIVMAIRYLGTPFLTSYPNSPKHILEDPSAPPFLPNTTLKK